MRRCVFCRVATDYYRAIQSNPECLLTIRACDACARSLEHGAWTLSVSVGNESYSISGEGQAAREAEG